MTRFRLILLILLVCIIAVDTNAQAQQDFDNTIDETIPKLMHRGGTGTYGTALSKIANFVSLNGYADFRYLHSEEEKTFSQSAVNLFVTAELSDKISTEFNIGFEKTDVEIEYAFLDYKFSEKFVARIGKFLLPTSDFNEYTSLSYMNRAIDDPLTVFASPSKWSSVGLQFRGKLGEEANSLRPYYSVYVVNGLAFPTGDEEEEEGEENFVADLVEAGEVEDNNEHKAFGGQFGVEYNKNFFASLSYHSSKYDSLSKLAANVMGASVGFDNEKLLLAAEYHINNLDITESITEDISGFFVMGAYKLKKFEPMIRFDQTSLDDETISRYTLGLNYYFRKTGLLKINYALQSSEGENEGVIGVSTAFTF